MNKAVNALRRIRGPRRPIVVILLLIFMMPVISLWASYRISELSERIMAVEQARLDLSRALRFMLDEETGLRGYVDTRRESFLEPYRVAHPQLEVLFTQLPAAFSGAGLVKVLPQIQDMSNLHAAWHVNVATPLLVNPRRSDGLAVQEDGKHIVDKMRSDVSVVHREAAGYTRELQHSMLDVQLSAAGLGVLWISIIGAFVIVIERRTMQRETELVMSLVEEREAVERLSDWRSRLLAMLAHDFKSQLAVIIGASHLLEDFPQRRTDGDLLASLRSAGYMLAEMADNAILLARSQERRLVLQRTAFDVTEIIDSVVQRYGAQREFHVYAQSRVAMVDGDRSYVTRVMDNIIGNAVKYSEEPIDVHVNEESAAICVCVTDRGIGIADGDMPHIFEEFWRSEKMQWSKKGSGVGLFIVKQIMEAHGGSIRVESEFGKGTTVSLCFPRAVTALPDFSEVKIKTTT